MSAKLSSIQRRTAEFVKEYELEAPVHARTLDLTSEVGELAKEALKGTGYGREEFDLPRGWEDELGDVLFSLVCLANSTGVELDGALDSALNKYRGRLESGRDAGSGR